METAYDLDFCVFLSHLMHEGTVGQPRRIPAISPTCIQILHYITCVGDNAKHSHLKTVNATQIRS